MRNKRVIFLRRMIVLLPMITSVAALIICISMLIRLDDLENRLKSVSFNSYVEQTVVSNNYIISGDSVSGSSVSGNSADGNVAERYVSADSIRAYITFDDGPSRNTAEILKILKEHNVKATFFVDGLAENSSSLRKMYRQIVSDGHTIAMHSYSHDYKALYESKESFESDLDKIHRLIYNETGVDSRMYRFPGGSGNNVSSLDISVYADVLHERGYEYWDWNVYPGDPDGRKLSAEQIADNVLNGIESYRTAEILLHDTGTKKATVDALPKIIEGLLDRNIAILPMDENTPLIQQKAE